MAFPELGFSTSILLTVNDLVIEQCAEDIRALPIPTFVSWRGRKHIQPAPNLYYLYTSYILPRFSGNATGRLWEGATVTFVAMQLAYFMGFKQVILIGVDHNFSTKGTPNTTIVSSGDDPNHFNPGYFGKGFRWQLPDLDTSEIGYSMARAAYEKAGREILDATVDGKLQIFPKSKFRLAILMNPTPLVSIVTPSYNQAPFLEKTMLSVLEQDYPQIEYLVADGGSNDGSLQIIQKYADRLAWWVSEKDDGQADAINKGLRRATGEIVAWLNSDDYYMPGAISEAVRVLNENPTVGMVYGNVQVVDESGKPINLLTYGDWGIQDLMSFHIIGQPAVFMRREVLEKAGLLDLSYHFLLDHQLWLRVALRGGMKYHPRLLAGAHYHSASKNLAQAGEFGKEAFRIVEWMKSEPEFAPMFKQNKRKINAGAERLNAFYLLDAKQYGESFRSYWRSFWLDPATVLPEWYRMVFALFAPLGLEKWKESFIQKRRMKYQ